MANTTAADNRARKKVSAQELINLAPMLDDRMLAEILMASSDLPGVLENFQTEEQRPTYPKGAADFMQQTLGYQMWGKLKEICDSVEVNHNTVVASGFGVGKSIVAASLACWFMTVNSPAVVVTLAPSHAQVQNVIWRYIRSVGRKAGLPGKILDTPRWEAAPDHYAVGVSPRKSSAEDVTAIQGMHGPCELIIMDEAAGIPRLIWDTVQGLAVGDNCRILAIGNPIEQAGPFWEACNSKDWHHTRISDLEHPNIIEGREVIPGAVSRQWVEARAREWATEVPEDTAGSVELPWLHKFYLPMPIFNAKVLGIAPEQGVDQLIRLSWVIDAENREFIKNDNAQIIASFDPAPRMGDDNALCIRLGNHVLSIERRKGDDTQELAQWLAMKCQEYEVTRVYVDDVGSGAGVTDRGRKLGLPIVAVNFGRSALQKKRFANLRAEAYWRVRELLHHGLMILPKDNLLEVDLCAPHYESDEYGRVKIESKDDIRERIKRSPDSADALALSYVTPLVDSDGNLTANEELANEDARWATAGSRWVRDADYDAEGQVARVTKSRWTGSSTTRMRSKFRH